MLEQLFTRKYSINRTQQLSVYNYQLSKDLDISRWNPFDKTTPEDRQQSFDMHSQHIIAYCKLK